MHGTDEGDLISTVGMCQQCSAEIIDLKCRCVRACWGDRTTGPLPQYFFIFLRYILHQYTQYCYGVVPVWCDPVSTIAGKCYRGRGRFTVVSARAQGRDILPHSCTWVLVLSNVQLFTLASEIRLNSTRKVRSHSAHARVSKARAL